MLFSNVENEYLGDFESLTDSFDPFTSKTSLLFTKKFLCYQCGEFGIGSANNPLSDIVLYSHDLSAGYCIDLCKEKRCPCHLWKLKG